MLNRIKNKVNEMSNSVMKDKQGYISRKLAAAWVITVIIVILAFFHVPINILFEAEVNQILESSDFTKIIQVVWATYFAANSIEHWAERRGNRNE